MFGLLYCIYLLLSSESNQALPIERSDRNTFRKDDMYGTSAGLVYHAIVYFISSLPFSLFGVVVQ